MIDNEKECINFLKRTNYYRLSAYFLPFRKKDGMYFDNIKFERIKRIYEFDSNMRALLFQCIEEIEIYFRTQLAYYNAHKYGALGYLEPTNFSDRHDYEKFSGLLSECVEENKKTLVARHHQEKYCGKFPIWVIIEFFSIGMLSYFYADMKTEEQKIITKDLYDTSPTYLRSWLRCVTDLRNRCAHYSRLYYWLFSAIPKLPKAEMTNSDRKLFMQVLMLKKLYPDREKWNSKPLIELKVLIEEYSTDISLKHIGFPQNWEEILKYL